MRPPACLALGIAALLLPLAAAARDEWVGVGAGESGVNECRAAFAVIVRRSSENASRWDVEITMTQDPEFTAIAVIPPQYHKECLLPRTRSFPDSRGSEVGQWRQDTSGACIDRHLLFSPLSTGDGGMATFEFTYRDRCVHFFDMGSGTVVMGTTAPRQLG